MAIKNATDATFADDIKEGLVLVDFWAPWCGPCKMIAPVLEELDVEMAGKVQIVKINVEEENAISEKYGVQSIPTLIVFKDGVVAEKAVGFKPKEALVELIENNA